MKNLKVISRNGGTLFRFLRKFSPVSTEGNEESIQPVILYDLNRDGLSEIILSASNLLFWNMGQGRFTQEDLIPPEFYQPISGKLIADLTGDGLADFLVVDLEGAIRLYQGNKDGRFNLGKARRCWPGKIANPRGGIQVFAMGDVDRDGDLDIWLGQYKPAYEDGQMPTPFYNANDGYPSYLLLNDGHGTFTDGTEQAGLAPKRYRRTYSCSFVDLDDDGDLDLWVVNDFAGVDMYYNDGKGHFTDVTAELIDETHGFGMAHDFGDFDGDGKLDIFVTGMASTTVRRLDFMGLGREDFLQRTRMRTVMTYGNRMYLTKEGRFVEAPFKDRVNRTGWSWGTTSFDLDNDGDLEIYVANGFISGKSAKDYCTRYWCHDIYTGSSQNNSVLDQLFAMEVTGSIENQGMSWNGYEHNHLLLNDEGKDFLNVAFLMGVAFEFDARGVISEDLDNNGFMDLLVVQHKSRPARGEALYILQNTHPKLPGHSNWIGVRLQEEGGGISPVGAKVTVDTGKRRIQKQIVNGRFYGVQHSNQLHFGLGKAQKVKSIEIRWIGGQTKRVVNPPINQHYIIHLENNVTP
ncbi:MAG: CRTAC1 family protein [Planctomycetes bacterium]|nr:CRTAC1 family protein [Planctomycetota bacterium]